VQLRLGVDLGGTKIEAVVLAAEDDRFEILARVRTQTEREKGYDHVVDATARAIAEVTKRASLGRAPPIGVGMPGHVTTRRADGAPSDVPLVKNSNTTCLNGRPFRRDLCARVGAQIAFANDANCFALAEATYGAAKDARVSFGVILGTGVGGGVVVRDRSNDRPWAWDGAQGIAGEWGHVVLEPEGGAPCYCGKRGCVETILAGPAIERRYRERTGVSHSVAEIAVRRANDAHARFVLAEVVQAFGRALAMVVDVLDPDVVVLGGGVSNLDLLYDEGVGSVARWVFNDELRTRIERHALGDTAGVIGAALLSPSENANG
jgi:fructokinase